MAPFLVGLSGAMWLTLGADRGLTACVGTPQTRYHMDSAARMGGGILLIHTDRPCKTWIGVWEQFGAILVRFWVGGAGVSAPPFLKVGPETGVTQGVCAAQTRDPNVSACAKGLYIIATHHDRPY